MWLSYQGKPFPGESIYNSENEEPYYIYRFSTGFHLIAIFKNRVQEITSICESQYNKFISRGYWTEINPPEWAIIV